MLALKHRVYLAVPKFQNIAAMGKKPTQKFELKQEIKRGQKYTSNEEETFFHLLCERILFKILQDF